MPKLIILGSSNAIASHDSENTHMVLVGAERIVLVDCVNNPNSSIGTGKCRFHGPDRLDLRLISTQTMFPEFRFSSWTCGCEVVKSRSP